MKPLHALSSLSFGLLLPALLHAQGAATANVGGTPGANGSVAPADQLTYTVTLSNSVIVGYNNTNGVSDSVNIAGNAAYVSGSERHPTSFIYSGGYLFGNSGQPSTSFQNFGVSQVLNTRKWTFVVGDVVGFLPSTPRYGLSGVPGVGDYGSAPVGSGLATGEAVLTNYGQRVSNNASASATYNFSPRTMLDLYGSYNLLRFLDGSGGFAGNNGLLLNNNGGINNNLLAAGAQLSHRLTGATTVGGAYNYSRVTYPSPYNFSFTSHAVLGTYQHTFGPRLSMSASAGPQWSEGSNSQFFPSRLGIAANFSTTYVAGRTNYAVTYSRSTNTGSGVVLGAVTDYASLNGQRRFSEVWTGGFLLGYGHSHTLSNVQTLFTNTNSFNAGLQANRRLGEHWSAFGSYAMQYQAVGQLNATDNAFNGVAHVLSFGVTYAPRPIHIGRR